MKTVRSHLSLHAGCVLIILGHTVLSLVLGTAVNRIFLLLMCALMAGISSWKEYSRSPMPWLGLLGASFVVWHQSNPTLLISSIGLAVVHCSLLVRDLRPRLRFHQYGFLFGAMILDIAAAVFSWPMGEVFSSLVLCGLFAIVWLSVLPDVPELVYRASGSVFPLSFLSLISLLLSTLAHRLAHILVTKTHIVHAYPMIDGGLELIASTMLIIGTGCLVVTAGELLSGWEIKLWIVPAFLVTGAIGIVLSILGYVMELPVFYRRSITEWYAIGATVVVSLILLRTIIGAWIKLRYQ